MSYAAHTQGSALVTGGAGFIGSHLIRQWLRDQDTRVTNVDALTYAGNLETMADFAQDPRHTLVQADVRDYDTLQNVLREHRPQYVFHLAAETHVDRSLAMPGTFFQTNAKGTLQLLKAVIEYWQALPADRRSDFRFLYVSTDEVFGPIAAGSQSCEESPLRPTSPYAQSKAAAGLLVESAQRYTGLPVLVVYPSNCYGQFQFPEKLIPVLVQRCLAGQPMPIYGDGLHVRDWLFVEDCCRALIDVALHAAPGSRYLLGGGAEEITNSFVAQYVANRLDELHPMSGGRSHTDLISSVEDRPGHDRRYASNYGRINSELGWQPTVDFETGLRRTVEWYIANTEWVRNVTSQGD